MPAPRPVALVTGATGGIGRAVAEALGTTHHVLVGGRSAARAGEVAASLPSAEPFVADLTAAGAVALPPELDVLVHSAGLDEGGPVADTGLEVWRRVFETNVFAVAELTRRALPALRRARGLVVCINSGAGLRSARGEAVYAGSKFALRAFADALREEERPHGVRVSSVHPGRTDSAMQQRRVAGEGDPYEPEYYLAPASVAEVVRLVVDLPAGASLESASVRPTRIRGV